MDVFPLLPVATYCVGVCMSALATGYSVVRWRRANLIADAFIAAPHWNLSENADNGPKGLAEGGFTVVSGSVITNSAPLSAFNGEESAVLVEEFTSKRQVLGFGDLWPHEEETTLQSVRDTDWGLSARSGNPTDVKVTVQRGAVQEAHSQDPASVLRGLTFAGSHDFPPTESWVVSLIRLVFWGVGSAHTTRKHFALPRGVPVSVAGTISLTIKDGSILATLSMHPVRGLHIFRDSVGALSTNFRRSGYMYCASAGLGLVLTAVFTWRVCRELWPHQTPSLRRRAAAIAGRLGFHGTAAWFLSLIPEGEHEHVTNDLRTEQRAYPDEAPDEGEDACIVCLSMRRVIAMVPCGHVCMCAGCLERFLAERGGAGRESSGAIRCPTCRAAVQTVVRVWAPRRS
jgi:hypothetical protein